MFLGYCYRAAVIPQLEEYLSVVLALHHHVLQDVRRTGLDPQELHRLEIVLLQRHRVGRAYPALMGAGPLLQRIASRRIHRQRTDLILVICPRTIIVLVRYRPQEHRAVRRHAVRPVAVPPSHMDAFLGRGHAVVSTHDDGHILCGLDLQLQSVLRGRVGDTRYLIVHNQDDPPVLAFPAHGQHGAVSGLLVQ